MPIVVKTDWGWIGVRATGRGIARIVLPSARRSDVLVEMASVLSRRPLQGGKGKGEGSAARFEKEAIAHLIRYFRTGRMDWNLPLDLDGATGFEKSVWQAARRIPRGEVITYGDLARRIGRPGSARAVGQALGRNPLPIAIPCHRIVGAGGRLTGFSAQGGLGLKERLLAHEGRGSDAKDRRS